MSTRGKWSRRVLTGAMAATFAISTLGTGLPVAHASALSAAIAPAAIPTFTLNGRGYGHGVGLSQYGARGFAAHGKTGEWIATYYYPGTAIGTATARSISVNIDRQAIYDSGSESYNAGYTRTYWRVRPGHYGGKLKVDGVSTWGDATYQVEPDPADNDKVRVVNTSTGKVVHAAASSIDMAETGQSPNLVQVIGTSGVYNQTYVRYRGKLVFKALDGRVSAVNLLPMDSYLYGVVPRESPSSWPLEALRAQAIVARSYAWTSSGTLYCTTSSQVYNGHSHGSDRTATTMHEASRSNEAVSSTSGKYVKYGTEVVKAFFYSSSGGHTARIEDIWPGTGEPSTTHPFRRAVSDPYDHEYSPYSPWDPPVRIAGDKLAEKLRWATSSDPPGAYVRSLRFDHAPTGHVTRAYVTWSNGSVSSDITGAEFRTALGLRSTLIDYYYFPTTRVGETDRYSTAASVSKTLYPSSGAGAVVVASGEDAGFADALTASGLAGVVKGPVLLTHPTWAPASTLAEVKRLKGIGATKLYIVGGTASVSSAVERTLAGAFGRAAKRLQGATRYDVAAAVAREMRAQGAPATSVLIASGEKWPDAALAGSLSAGTGRPVLLASSRQLPQATVLALRDLAPTQTIVMGGKLTLPDAVVSRISPAPSVRFAAADRFALATAIAGWAMANAGYTAKNVYLVTAARFPDSITGGVLAGHAKEPLLMTQPTRLPSATADFLRSKRGTIERVTIVGGTSSVGSGAYQGVCKAMN